MKDNSHNDSNIARFVKWKKHFHVCLKVTQSYSKNIIRWRNAIAKNVKSFAIKNIPRSSKLYRSRHSTCMIPALSPEEKDIVSLSHVISFLLKKQMISVKTEESLGLWGRRNCEWLLEENRGRHYWDLIKTHQSDNLSWRLIPHTSESCQNRFD